MADEKKPVLPTPAAPLPVVDEKVQLAVLVASEVAKALSANRPGAERPTVRPLEAEFKGTRRYYVGPARAYHDGRLMQAGEIVTITDRRPCRDWRPVDEAKPAPAVAAPSTGRASDKTVG